MVALSRFQRFNNNCLEKMNPISLSRSLLRKRFTFLRFMVVGAWNASFSLILFYSLIYILGDRQYQIVLVTTFLISTIQSYITQKYLVWKLRGRRFREFMHFAMTSTVQYVANAIIMYLLVSELRFPPKVMQIPVSFFIAVGSYFYFKTRVFAQG